MTIFSTALSGLNAAKAALEVTSHNISNVNTPGFHRQRLEQANSYPEYNGFGFVGRGVDMTAVNRMYDRYMERQLNTATSADSGYKAQLGFLNQVEDLLGDPQSTLGSAVDEYFRALQGVSKEPTSVAARQTAINQAQALAGRMQLVHGRLEEMRKGVNTQIISTVSSINAIADKIAQLNNQIMATGSTAGRQPNDLMDQRDQLVVDLNKLVKADASVQADGSYNVSIGSGQTLVVGAKAYTLQTVPATDDPEQLEIAYQSSGGSVLIPTSLLDGGQLGGLIHTKNEALNRSQADLGRLAIEISDQINRQSRLGRDLYNQAGGNVFTDLNPYRANPVGTGVPVETLNTQLKKLREASSRFSVAITDPSALAVSSAVKASLPTSGATSPFISSIWQVNTGSNTAPLTPFTGPLNLVYTPGSNPPFSAAGYTVTASTNVTGGYRMDDGAGTVLEFKPEKLGATGATFVLDAKGTGTASADFTPGDGANMLEMVKIQTKNTMTVTPNGTTDFVPASTVTPTANFAGFYGQMVSFIGNRTNEVRIASDAQAVTLKETQLARESFSGVNMDEEAQNLLRFQQAYQASSKSIQIASQIFSELLQLGR